MFSPSATHTHKTNNYLTDWSKQCVHNKRVKFTLEQATKALRRSRIIVILFL
jgi:hypothetical protein